MSGLVELAPDLEQPFHLSYPHIFVDGGYVDMVQMGMLRSEWEARQG